MRQPISPGIIQAMALLSATTRVLREAGVPIETLLEDVFRSYDLTLVAGTIEAAGAARKVA
jgi:hypothetical protein